MNQKQLYTDFWELLSLSEDFVQYGHKSEEYKTPEFRVAPKESSKEDSTQTLPIGESVPRPRITPQGDILPGCAHCPLIKSGRKAIPGVGSSQPKVLILAGPPSQAAEELGKPFAHAEMDHFLKWMSAINLDQEKDVYLANFPGCRAPGSRDPFPDELKRCAYGVGELIGSLNPQVILTLGEVPAAFLTQQAGKKVSQIRGSIYQFRGKPLICTYSPEQSLQFPQVKRPVWEDLKAIREVLNG